MVNYFKQCNFPILQMYTISICQNFPFLSQLFLSSAFLSYCHQLLAYKGKKILGSFLWFRCWLSDKFCMFMYCIISFVTPHVFVCVCVCVTADLSGSWLSLFLAFLMYMLYFENNHQDNMIHIFTGSLCC